MFWRSKTEAAYRPQVDGGAFELPDLVDSDHEPAATSLVNAASVWPPNVMGDVPPPTAVPAGIAEGKCERPLVLSGAFAVPASLAATADADRIAAAFGKIVSLLMHAETTRERPLADLVHLVLPAIAVGHYAIIDATTAQTGHTAPAAAVLWASVSADVDRRLTDGIATPVQIAANEWHSGDIVWIVEAVGEAAALRRLLDHLHQTRFTGATVKLRTRTPNGRGMVPTLGGVNAT